MENASKALLIAGSVLVSVLIIGLLVFGYRQISDLQQTRADAEDNTKLVEYMSQFESFNRVLYGSEVFSLANLREDYNADDDIQDGYKEIEITIKISRSIAATTYFQADTYNIEEIDEQKDELEDEIASYEKVRSSYNGRSVKYYAERTYREIANDFNVAVSSTDLNYDIQAKLEANSRTNRLMQEIYEYQSLRSIYTEFKEGKRFRCTNVEYDPSNGRIIEMNYEEI